MSNSYLANFCCHCHSSDMTFRLFGSTRNPAKPSLIDSYGVCQRCFRGALFTLVPFSDHAKRHSTYSPTDVGGDVLQHFKVIGALPEAPKNEAPEHTPESVAAAYVDAVKSLNTGLWTPAGVMARKTIDVATKSLNPQTKKGSPLKGRIDELRKNALITEALQTMAHVVRLDGNDAAHEEDPFTEEEAKEICEFARLFLTLTFTVNGNAAAASAKHASSEAESQP